MSGRQPEDGYELWLRYLLVDDADRLAEYRAAIKQIFIETTSSTLIAARDELLHGLQGLLGVSIPLVEPRHQPGMLYITSMSNSFDLWEPSHTSREIGREGYILSLVDGEISLYANTDIGVLYGVFAFLRHLQMHQPLADLPVVSAPKIDYRILHHWDNLDRTIERGYAGFSLWDWHKLPDYLDPRYRDYARANASIGINGAVLTNANAKSLSLTHPYLLKAAALADVFRPYGIRVYLSARFTAPMEIDGLATADPLDPDVIAWWQAKVDEIYALIPDFGGFTVKANSEGQPGPRDYGRTQADGANLLAQVLAPKGGIVNWRAFIYDDQNPADRARQAYDELVPLDGAFDNNVFLQVKNGPVDFQPREPYHPVFGAMPRTQVSLEVQITQEYLGHATHLAYLAPLYRETLDADCTGIGGLVAQVIDGSLDGHALSAIVGVSNIGDERNWCGHPFAAANWYTFGRLAWDHRLSSAAIADEWLRLTFTNEARFVQAATGMMMTSREAVVSYMTPLGLHHLMARNHHYGPGPWVDGGRADWTSVYYHRADALGLGFDRTASGSNAVSQYCAPYREQIANLETCPEKLLLWFHHVPWQHQMQSGRSLWDELCYQYQSGVETVRWMQAIWASLNDCLDSARFEHVRALLKIQEQEARWWRDACLLYFQTFSQMAIPPAVEPPEHSLDFYRTLTHYYVPGIRERRFD